MLICIKKDLVENAVPNSHLNRRMAAGTTSGFYADTLKICIQ